MNPSGVLAKQLAEELFWNIQPAEIINEETDEVEFHEPVILLKVAIEIIKRLNHLEPDFSGWAQELTDIKFKGQNRIRYKVANKIQSAMKDKGITQADLANMLNKKPSQINRLLSGENMTINTIVMFQNCLGINLLDLT